MPGHDPIGWDNDLVGLDTIPSPRGFVVAWSDYEREISVLYRPVVPSLLDSIPCFIELLDRSLATIVPKLIHDQRVADTQIIPVFSEAESEPRPVCIVPIQ